ncbi:hypothetical protein [Streptomyces sp. NPDC048442]|uniref:hypothetical protein n=1 Tax=Streptomyces sp. NPDC048442 TaxID=3154823 RepID=UPI00341D1558
MTGNRRTTGVREEKGNHAMNRSAPKHLPRASLALATALASIALCGTAGATSTAGAVSPGGTASAVVAGSGAGGSGSAVGVRTGSERACPVVYFDLGETLVHTAEDGSIGYRAGAADYLRALRERRIRIGLITNVPPAWGATDAERAARLKKEVDATWRGSAPFAWKDFGDRILTPRTEAERKPAPALWQRAKANSGRCLLVYQAETAEEVEVAASLGHLPYQIGLPHRPAYLPAWLIGLLGNRSR